MLHSLTKMTHAVLHATSNSIQKRLFRTGFAPRHRRHKPRLLGCGVGGLCGMNLQRNRSPHPEFSGDGPLTSLSNTWAP